MKQAAAPTADTLYTIRHENHADKNFSLSVIEAVATVLNIDPTEHQLHLEEHIDLDSLNALYHAARTHEHTLNLAFDYGDCTIHIDHNGNITIRGCQQAHEQGTLATPTRSMR